MTAGGDRWRLVGLALRVAGQLPVAWLRRNARGPGWRVPKPERLLFAPKDLRTSDPTIAADIYDGLFTFAGLAVEMRGRSPFEIVAPSPAWGRALYGFDWLRHLRAADTPLARENARTLVTEAIGLRRRDLDRGLAREPRVVARRLISFLCQSPLVLNGAERSFYQLFLREVGRSATILERDAVAARKPSDRLAATIALSYAALCCSGFENRLRRATRLLSAELDRQVLPDGGHVSRHPGVVVDLLLDLLPLRLLYASRNIAPPEALGRAIDRMMPMLRYLRGSGRELALFNGMGPTAVDELATLFSYDAVHGKPPAYAAQSGYMRLDAGATTLIADTGPAPPLESSTAAHAGCLSFELWSDGERVVVNMGTPRAAGPARAGTRRTAAHSTLCLGEVSSAAFLDDVESGVAGWLERRLGPALIGGPVEVAIEREADADGWAVCTARHDGYLSRFGVRHERRWRLSPDGMRLEGQDRLRGAARQQGSLPARAIRFHLHPTVTPELDGGAVLLSRRTGERWRFEAGSSPVGLESSLYFGGADGARPTRQIVLRLEGPSENDAAAIRWSFERLPAASLPAGGLQPAGLSTASLPPA